jgi:adenylate cyclase
VVPGLKFRIPISIKLVVMSTGLLLLAALTIAFQTSKQLEHTATGREFSENSEVAGARATQIEELVATFQDKTKVIASLLLKEYAKPEERRQALELAFYQDRDLVSVEVWSTGDKSPVLAQKVVQESYLKSFDVPEDYVTLIHSRLGFPLPSVFAGNVEVRNSSVPKGAPLLTIGFPFVKDELGRITHVAVADFRLGRVQRAFGSEGARAVYLLDAEGHVVAHPNDTLAIKAEKLDNIPIVQEAAVAKVKIGQMRFMNPIDGEAYIGAYGRTSYGLIVISQVAEKTVLEPARVVRREAFYIAGLAISAALFFVFVFSITLTNPIERLVELTREIAHGNFDVHATSQVRSHDEVGELAIAFDSMTEGLKERDKVKNMFSKFHGSSVAEDILQSGGASLRGTSREVVVFFSDIRDFTKFSEGPTAEEVVEMLNEYFEIMVGIINRSGGVVDKFIGDAIMAVWGAPTSSGHDQEHALKACLDMRQALAELNERRAARGKTPIKIGMGVHSGRAISGTIGSTERMEYTVIGDTVNMAARIEASTKAFGTDLLVSAVTADIVKEQFILEKAGNVEVKGISEPLTLYKIRGTIAADGTRNIVKTPFSDYEASGDDKVKVA